jgi:hypothetical protein
MSEEHLTLVFSVLEDEGSTFLLNVLIYQIKRHHIPEDSSVQCYHNNLNFLPAVKNLN